MSSQEFDALIFDCDGTLVESEPITFQVLGEMLAELGWKATPEEIATHFLGRSVTGQIEFIRAKARLPMQPDWLARYRERRNEALGSRVTAIPGAFAAVSELASWKTLRLGVASASDRRKVCLQLERTSLIGFFGDNIYSGHDVRRNKPYPDVYLNAAARMQVPISRCAVVEDSVAGITAAVAAGATVFGYVPDGRSTHSFDALMRSGQVILFRDMRELPGLLGVEGVRIASAMAPSESV